MIKLQLFILVLCLSTCTCTFSKFFNPINDLTRDISGAITVRLAQFANKLIRLYEKFILHVDDRLWDTTDSIREEYDFIVVGAGSAGSVVADRLSEIADWNILVLEAGQPETEFVDVPLLAAGFQGSIFDWNYVMEPQINACLGMKEKRMPCPRGKAIGGTSVLNYMIYSRGAKEDYDYLDSLGNKGWSYDEVLPYFKKSEGAGDLFKVQWEYHNKNGPLSVEDTFQSSLVDAMLKAGKEIGLPTIDYNAPVQKYGVSPVQSTTKDGRRYSTGRAFLSPVSRRSNLDIVIEALVTEILIHDKKARGVKFEKGGQVYSVKAKKEVIVCAGAINSPQLLMLSGIGRKKDLQKHSIKVIKDLQGVGQNLADHICFYGLSYKVYFDWDQTTLAYITSIGDFVLKGKGPFTTLGGVEGLGFVKTNLTTYIPDAPDIEYLFVRGHLGTDDGIFIKSAFRFTDAVYDNTYGPLQDDPVWTIAPVLLHPMSSGEVKLKSSDPHDPPLIYGNYFSDPENLDIKRMIAAIRIIQKMEDTSAFRSDGATINNLPVYGCDHWTFNSDDYWECALRTVSVTLYHQMRTCKMGPKSDPMAVVDHELKVYGIKNLRVADASVLVAVSGHTNAPAIMIGEKVSDLIKKQYGVL